MPESIATRRGTDEGALHSGLTFSDSPPPLNCSFCPAPPQRVSFESVHPLDRHQCQRSFPSSFVGMEVHDAPSQGKSVALSRAKFQVQRDFTASVCVSPLSLPLPLSCVRLAFCPSRPVRFCKHAPGELELKILGKHVRDFTVHRERQPQSLAGSDVLWRLWVFEFQAQRNPLLEVLENAGNTVAERLDCDTRIAEQARVSELDEFSQVEDVFSQAWRQAIRARRVGSTDLPPDALPRLTAQTDRTCSIPLRTEHGPTVAQSPNLS